MSAQRDSNYTAFELPVLLVGGDGHLPNRDQLHRVIAETILRSAHVLGDTELNFLRVHMGMSRREFGNEFLLPASFTSDGHLVGSLTDLQFRYMVVRKLGLSITQRELAKLLHGRAGCGSRLTTPIRVDTRDPEEPRLVA